MPKYSCRCMGDPRPPPSQVRVARARHGPWPEVAAIHHITLHYRCTAQMLLCMRMYHGCRAEHGSKGPRLARGPPQRWKFPGKTAERVHASHPHPRRAVRFLHAEPTSARTPHRQCGAPTARSSLPHEMTDALHGISLWQRRVCHGDGNASRCVTRPAHG